VGWDRVGCTINGVGLACKKAEKAKKLAEKKAKSSLAADTLSKNKEEKTKPKAISILQHHLTATAKGEKKVNVLFDDPQLKAYNPAIVESAHNDW
jgi:hypothetical protein